MMTSDTRSPEEIEREIERERAGLSSTLDDLQNRFSVETIARQFTDQFREHGGDIGRSVSDAVKRNPVALALTGVGLAWLMMGDKSGGQNHSTSVRRVRHVDYGHQHDDDQMDMDHDGRMDSSRSYGASNSSQHRSLETRINRITLAATMTTKTHLLGRALIMTMTTKAWEAGCAVLHLVQVAAYRVPHQQQPILPATQGLPSLGQPKGRQARFLRPGNLSLKVLATWRMTRRSAPQLGATVWPKEQKI